MASKRTVRGPLRRATGRKKFGESACIAALMRCARQAPFTPSGLITDLNAGTAAIAVETYGGTAAHPTRVAKKKHRICMHAHHQSTPWTRRIHVQ